MAKAKAQAKRGGTLKRMKRYWVFYLMALPAIVYIIINNYIPMGGIIVAFKNYRYDKGIFGSDWVGLKNFQFLFRSTDSWLMTRNTILYNLAFILLGTLLSITLAILLNEVRGRRTKKAYQTVVLVPHLISMVVVSYLANGFLDPERGVLNQALAGLGMAERAWYSEPGYWPFIIIFVYLLCNIGFLCIVYMSTLVGIDRTYYEAASIDGASTWQKIRCITLPFLKPTVITMTLLALGKIMYSDFGLFYQVPMNVGTLYDVTTTIDVYIYRGLMLTNNIGMSSAAALYQSLVGFILVLTANLVVRRLSRENALF